MDALLAVQQQLSRVLDDVSLHSQDPPASSTAAMTPVLIRIEQLLDEIRSCTRSIASQKRKTEKKAFKHVEDFRIKLESEDIVDYDSETETEDETKEEEQVDVVGEKRLRDAEEGEIAEKSEFKRFKVSVVQKDGVNGEKRLRNFIKQYIQVTKKCSMLKEEESLLVVKKAMNNVAMWATKSTKLLLAAIEKGETPSVDVATDFRDATILLPSIVKRCQSARRMSKAWITNVTNSINQIVTLAKGNANLPACLSDPQLETTRHEITEKWKSRGSDALHRMEEFIDLMNKPGVLNPECMETPLGKLASMFRIEFKTCPSAKKPSRTEEEWAQFARIGEVLADWIQLSEQAKTPPKLRPHLQRFDRQLKGFAKKNPGRVPARLMECAGVLAQFAPEPNSKTNTNEEQNE